MCVCVLEDGNTEDKRRKGLTLRKSKDEREKVVEPPLNFNSFVR